MQTSRRKPADAGYRDVLWRRVQSNDNITGSLGASAEEERERLLGEAWRRAGELEAVLASLADGLIICDATGEILRINATAQSILGYSAAECSLPFDA